MAPSIWAYWRCPECDRSENFAPRDAQILKCDFCRVHMHNDSNPQKDAETPHKFVYWRCLHCGRPDRPVAQGTPCVYQYDFCGRQADDNSAEEACALNSTSREEKLGNEILWDGTPSAGYNQRKTFREIIREDATQSEHKEYTYQGEKHASSRMDFERAHESLTSKKQTLQEYTSQEGTPQKEPVVSQPSI